MGVCVGVCLLADNLIVTKIFILKLKCNYYTNYYDYIKYIELWWQSGERGGGVGETHWKMESGQMREME